MQDEPIVNLSGAPDYSVKGTAISPPADPTYTPLNDPNPFPNELKNKPIGGSDITMAEAAQYNPSKLSGGIMYGETSENTRAQNQSAISRIGNAGINLVNKTGAYIIQNAGFIGGAAFSALGGLVNYGNEALGGEGKIVANGNAVSLMSDNFLTQIGDAWKEAVQEANPIYKTDKYTNGNIWQKLATTSWWLDDAIDRAALTGAMLIPGMLESKGLFGVAGLAMREGGAIEASGMIPKVAKYLADNPKMYGTIGRALGSDVYEAAATGVVDESTAAGLAFKKAVQTAQNLEITSFNVIGQNALNGRESQTAIVKSLNEQRDKGLNTYTDDEIKDMAAEGAKASFWYNMPLTLLSSMWEMPQVFASFKGATNLLKKITGAQTSEELEQGITGAIGKSSAPSFWNLAWKAPITALEHGQLESSQVAIGRYVEEAIAGKMVDGHLEKKGQGEAFNPWNISDAMTGSFGEYINNFHDPNGENNIALGTIQGLLTTIFGRAFKGFTGEYSKQDKANDNLLKGMNEALASRRLFNPISDMVETDKEGNIVTVKGDDGKQHVKLDQDKLAQLGVSYVDAIKNYEDRLKYIANGDKVSVDMMNFNSLKALAANFFQDAHGKEYLKNVLRWEAKQQNQNPERQNDVTGTEEETPDVKLQENLEYVDHLYKIYNAIDQRHAGFLNLDVNYKDKTEAALAQVFTEKYKTLQYNNGADQVFYNNQIAKNNTELGGITEKSTDDGVVAQRNNNLLDQNEILNNKLDISKQEYKNSIDRDLINQAWTEEKAHYQDIKNTIEKIKQDAIDESTESKSVTKIPINTKYGERQIETNTDYVVGKVIDKDEQGNDVFSAPIIRVLGKNEDGTIKIQYNNNKGQWVNSDISEDHLDNYSLTKRSDLQKNKKANYVFEHWNTMFQHWGIKDNKGNPVTGRLEYNQAKNQILFKYIDDKGKERRREIIGRNVVTQDGYNHPMLQAVGELKASQKQATDEFAKTPTSLSDKLTLRNNVIASLYENGVARIEQIKKTLETNKESLSKYEETLKEETTKLEKETTRKRVIKKQVRAVEASIKNLTDLHERIEKENIELQNEKEEIEYNLPIFEELLNSIDSSAEESKDILQQLKDDVDNSEKLIDVISKQLKANKALTDQIQKVLSENLSILKDYIKRLQEGNPNLPLSIDEFQDNIEKYLGEEGAKQLIAERGGFTEQVMALENDILDFEEELNIPSLSKEVVTLQKEATVLNEQLDDAIKLQMAKDKIYEAFKEFVDKLAQEEKEEQEFEKNEELKKQYIGTMDDSMQNVLSEIHYEPASKKSFWSVIRGTRPFTLSKRQIERGEEEKPHNVRANRFGFKFSKFSEEKQAAIRGIVVTQNTQNDILPGLTDFLMKDATPEQLRKYKKEEIIALAMVQMNDDGQTYSLVDENGDVIPEKDETGNTVNPLDRAIFQTFPMRDLKGFYKSKDAVDDEDMEEQTMFRDDVPEKKRLAAEEQYQKWRDATLQKTTLDPPEKIKVSFGIPELAKRTDEKGNLVPDKGARTSAKKAGFVSDEDLDSHQVITVSTEDEANEGEVTFNNSKGRVFLRVPGQGLVKLFNRKFSDVEANTIFDVIQQICKNGAKKGQITPETNLLINWLKTVVYWGIAKDPNTNERKAAGYNNIWFETTKEEGKPVTRLYISGITKDKSQAFMFTPTGLQESKYEIVSLLQNLYHNTFATKVNQDSWQNKYYEIKGIDKEGNPITEEWPNYQTYLLSDKSVKDGKLSGERNEKEIPLVTQYKPITNENDVNRKSIYFTLNSPTSDYNFEAEEQKAETPKTKKEAKKPATEESKTKTKKEETAYKPALLKLDGSDEMIHFDSFGGFDMMFKLNAKTSKEKGTIDSISYPQKALDALQNQGKTLDQAKAELKNALLAKLKDQLNLANVPKAAPIADALPVAEKTEVKENNIEQKKKDIEKRIPAYVDFSKGKTNSLNTFRNEARRKWEGIEEDVITGGRLLNLQTGINFLAEAFPEFSNLKDMFFKKSDSQAIGIKFSDLVELIDTLRKQGIDTEEDIGNKIKSKYENEISELDKTSKETKQEPKQESTTIEDTPMGIKESQQTLNTPEEVQNKTEEDDDIPSIGKENNEAAFRIVPSEKPVIYEQEDWDKVEKDLTKMFSVLPVYRVRNAIRATNGRQIWGMLHEGGIYLDQNAEVGTIYHEVFEAVWKMFAGPEEKGKVLDEFRSRDGSYRDRFNPMHPLIEYKNAKPEQIKEEIAEEFRDLRLYGTRIATPRGQNFIARLFQNIIDFIKTFFTGEKSQRNTQDLFDKIGNGYYNRFNPYEAKLSFAKKGFINVEDAFPNEDSELREKIPTQQTHDIIQHMTFAFMRDVTKTNQSLFQIEKLKKAEIYANLRLEILGRIKGVRDAYAQRAQNGEQAAIDGVNATQQLYDNTKAEWNALVERHEQFLNTRGYTFDENDELNMEDENKGKDEPYGDPRKVDSFRKSNAAIKNLLGSVAYSQRVKRMINGKEQISTEFVPSTIGGAKLLAPDQVHIDLVNKLSKACDLDDMFSLFRKAAIDNPNYESLYHRVAKQTIAENTIDYDKFEDFDWQLISAFWKSFKLQNPDALTVFILSDGNVIVSDSSMNTATKQSKKEMFYSMVNKIKSDDWEKGKEFFTYNKKNGKYTATKTLKDIKFSGTSLTNYILFLKKLGIDFKEEDLNDLRPTQLKHFRDAVKGMHTSLANLGPVFNKVGEPIDEDGYVVDKNTHLSKKREDAPEGKPQNDKSVYSLTSKTLDIEGRLTQLGVIKAIIDRPEFESTYFNINGERTQTYIGSNAASRLYDTISSLKNLNDLNSDVKDYKQFRYLLTDAFTQGSVILNRIFLMDSTKARRDGTENILKTTLADGMNDEEKGKSRESSKQSYKQRLIQEINLNTNGCYLNLVPADASMEHATRMHEETTPFVTDDSFLTGGYLSIFKDYFTSELTLSRDRNRRVVKGKKKSDMRFFKDILGDELHNNIVSKLNKDKSPEDVYEKYHSKIEAAVKNFILNEADDTYDLLKTFDIVKEDVDGLTAENLNFANNMDSITEKDLKTKLGAISANYVIANIEMHKLLYSDPYQYENELKRIKNFLSPRQYLMHGSPRVNSALNNVYNKGFKKGDIGYTDMNRDHFRVATLADVWSTADLDGYYPFEETDGGGMITIKGKRMLMLRAGMWTDALEKQFRHDIEYERIVKETKNDIDREKALANHELNNPGVKELYTPLKPIVAGSKANGRNYNDAVLQKFALSVYSYRILHQLDPNSNAIKLYNKMTNEDIDYAIFASGVKVGAEKQFNIYNQDGSFNDDSFETQEERDDVNKEQGVTKIPYSIMAIQSEVPTKEGNDVTQGSQMTKLVTMDFMDAGMPIDFMATEKDFDKRMAKWIELKDKGSYNKGDNLYNEIKNNQSLHEARKEEAYKTLLNKLGIEKTADGFKIADRDKLSTALSGEIMRREINDNIINAFKEFKQKNVILEATPSYQQIRHVLYSIADKSLVHPKITGGQKVQIPSTFLESIRGKAIEKTDEDGKKKTTYTSDILKFYVNEDGKRVCQIMCGRWFNSDLSDEALLHYLNDTEEGKRILRGVAFRIPTQKQNSIDTFEIAKFLPKEYGDSVVIPSALVKKTGSDFDIDKLSMYLKNIFQDTDGNLKLVPYKGIGEEAKRDMKMAAADFLNRKMKSLEGKLEKNENMQDLFGKLSLGQVSEKTFNKWLPILKDWFGNNLVDGKLPVADIEQFFMDKIESINKKLSTLNDDDMYDIMNKEQADRWYRQSLDNEYIESCERLISHPLNFKHLTDPNSSKQLEDIEKGITKALGEEEIDYANVGNMLNRRFMSSLRQAFVAGKQMIAMAAIGQTNNAQNQRFISYIDTDRLNTPGMISLEDNEVLGGNEKSQMYANNPNINFQEYNSVIIKGKRVATLSKAQDANINSKKRNFISDIISQIIDGCVDIAKKGPWVTRLGITPTLAPTWLFLIKIGVPIKSVAYFMNQPIIKDYVKQIENKGYSWLFISDFIENSLDSYSPSKEQSISEIPSEEELEKTVGKKANELSDSQLAQQQYMLKEFLKYAKMSSHLLQITQGSNFDTAYLSDPLIITKKLMQYERAKNSIISSVDDLIDASFVRKLKDIISNVRKAFAEVLISDKKNVLDSVLGPYINMNDRDFLKLAQKAVSDLFDWAMQTDQNVAGKIANVLVNKKVDDKEIKSYVRQVMDFKDKIFGDPAKNIKPDINHPLYNNFVLKALQLKPGEKEGKVDNLLIKGKENKVYDQNMVIHGFEEIRDYLKNKGDDTLYRKLLAITVMQSGLKKSILSFTDLLPYEDFKDVYYNSLINMNDVPYLSDFHTAHIFERNNYNEDDIIPFIKDKFSEGNPTWRHPEEPSRYYKNQIFVGDGLLKAQKKNNVPMIASMDIASRQASGDFMVYSWQDKISVKERIKRRKNGDTSHIYKLLMKKVYYENEEGKIVPLVYISEVMGKDGITRTYKRYIYKAINTLGDSYMAREFPTKKIFADPNSTLMNPSLLNNGFDKVEEKYDANGQKISSGEVEDETVAYYFSKGEKNTENEVVEEPAYLKNENAPEGLPPIKRSPDQTIKLKDGTFKYSEVSSDMLEQMGYSPKEIGEKLKMICD
jgi:hypothetical protein